MSGPQPAQQREQEQARLRAAQVARPRQHPARGKPAPLSAAGNQALAAKVDRRTRSTWLRGSLFATMGQGPTGFAVDRWTLAIAESSLVALDGTTDVALHPSLAPLLPLWRAGHLALVRGIGFENPNRSHFVSMDRWWRADDTPRGAGS